MPELAAINPNAPFQLFQLGPDQEPVLLVDDVLADPRAMVEHAAGDGVYGPAGAAYPGIRRAAPETYLSTLFDVMSPLLRKVFGFSPEVRFRLDSSFSMVTEAPANLRHNQRVPHIDRNGPNDLAMVHYLCGPEFGGTHFFRHRSTGFQRLTPEREPIYNAALNGEMNRQVLPSGFPDDEHPLFERVATVEARFNRLVVYRAGILHSPAIAFDAHYSPDPHHGRLTMTSFLFEI